MHFDEPTGAFRCGASASEALVCPSSNHHDRQLYISQHACQAEVDEHVGGQVRGDASPERGADGPATRARIAAGVDDLQRCDRGRDAHARQAPNRVSQ